jgi:anti-sigma regulatory factor (Ser/Thr protein kinase)
VPAEQFVIREAGSLPLRRMSEWWEATGLRAALDEWTAMRVDLCLSEAVGNVLEHGYGAAGGDPWVRITVSGDAGSVRVLLEDEAPGFNPLNQPEAQATDDLQGAGVGGRGILLMRRYADALDYRRERGRNCLSLVVRPTR